MENAFLSEDRADDLLKWAKNIEAIGYTIQALVEAEHKFGDLTLEVHGDALGGIIQDYAKAIHETVAEAFPAINDFFREKERASAHPASETEAPPKDPVRSETTVSREGADFKSAPEKQK